MLIQLNPPLPIMTPKGCGMCHFLIDYGMDFDLIWVAFIASTGECWSFPNPKIRGINNITLGREYLKE